MEENNVEQRNVENTEGMNGTNNTQNVNQNKSINICGLLSFIFSMVGILMFGLPCGIIATILGIIGIATFKPEINKAKWMGITGLVVGICEILIMGLYIAVMI